MKYEIFPIVCGVVLETESRTADTLKEALDIVDELLQKYEIVELKKGVEDESDGKNV